MKIGEKNEKVSDQGNSVSTDQDNKGIIWLRRSHFLCLCFIRMDSLFNSSVSSATVNGGVSTNFGSSKQVCYIFQVQTTWWEPLFTFVVSFSREKSRKFSETLRIFDIIYVIVLHKTLILQDDKIPWKKYYNHAQFSLNFKQ